MRLRLPLALLAYIALAVWSAIAYPLIATAQEAPTRALLDTTDGIHIWNDQIDLRNLTGAQLRFAATRYAGSQKQTRPETRRLREHNPNFLVLHYRLGQALGHSTPDRSCNPTGPSNAIQIVEGDRWIPEWPGNTAIQDSWLYRWNGQRVFSCDWGHYLAELDDPGWREWWTDRVIAQLEANESDGVFADSYSIPSYFGPNAYRPQLPIVDAAFEADWARKQREFTDYVRSRFAGRWWWVPNVGALVTTRDPSDFSNLDGFMVEGFAFWGKNGYFAPADWALQQDRILNLVRDDKIAILQTYPDPTDVEQRLFGLGTYVLVKGRHTFLNLEMSMAPEWFPEYDVPLGPALDPLPARIRDLLDPTWNVYARRFERGLVLVNPSNEPRPVTLSQPMLRVRPEGGGPVAANGTTPGSLTLEPVAELTLGPHQAAILLTG